MLTQISDPYCVTRPQCVNAVTHGGCTIATKMLIALCGTIAGMSWQAAGPAAWCSAPTRTKSMMSRQRKGNAGLLPTSFTGTQRASRDSLSFSAGVFREPPVKQKVWMIYQLCINSLAPGKFEWHFRYLIFQIISVIDGWGISCEIALWWMSLDLTDDKSTLVQVMAWCRQATSHYLSQCWPRYLSPYGVTRPQWVKLRRQMCVQLTHWILGAAVVFFKYIPGGGH